MRGWAKAGVLARVFAALQQEQIIELKIQAGSGGSENNILFTRVMVEQKSPSTLKHIVKAN